MQQMTFDFFSEENKSLLFMWIYCLETIYMEYQDFVSLEKKRMLSATYFDWYFKS